jgi:hypothetical protein
LLLPQILPDILGRHALPSGRLAALGATPGLSPRAAREYRCPVGIDSPDHAGTYLMNLI